MPYRRLPNTDNARIRSLKAAISKMGFNYNRDIIKLDIQSIENLLRNFESAQLMYKQSLDKQASENRKFQKNVKNAKLYISHFIQVLNLCVIRNEIKKDAKIYYQLEPDNFAVPDMSSNEALLKWGENIIKGENTRIQKGGIPIYNPTIARVNVAFAQFKDAYFAQKTFQNTTSRNLEQLSLQRDDIDNVLCLLWNQIEAAFADLPTPKRLEACKEFGIIYYLRKNEKDTDVSQLNLPYEDEDD